MKKIFSLVLVFLFAISIVSAVELTVNDPEDDGVYNSRSVLLDLESDSISDFFVTKNVYTKTGWRRLCRNEEFCVKDFRFNEGENEILIKAVSSLGEIDLEELSFYIDTKNPMISRTEPRRRSVIRGEEFKVRYREENLESVTLHYGGDSAGMRTETKTDCDSGRNIECIFSNIDLEDYDGQEIRYWFEIEDIAENMDVSQEVIVTVDTSEPIVHFFDYQIERRRVNFIFEIEDENFDAIFYIDDRDIVPRSKKLCSRLEDGRCNVRKSFRKGEHDLEIFVVDKAGNEVEVTDSLEFLIV